MFRDKCFICNREIANEADWEHNGELSDKEAADAGLNALCWEPQEDDCLSVAIEIGRPLSYGEAMRELYARSLTDSLTAVEAAVAAYRKGALTYTRMDLRQGPGEGNYDRIERLQIEDAIRAAEKARTMETNDD